MQIEFAWERRDEVVKAVAKLARRAAKLGVPFVATVGEAITREVAEVEPNEHGLAPVPTGRVFTYGQIALETPSIAYTGWTLLGVLSPLPTDETGSSTILYPSAVPGQELPADVRTWTQRCDHCQTIRHRTETFIVRHDSGETKQVGRNCIRDFLGHDADRFLSAYGFWDTVIGTLDEENLGYGGSVAPKTYLLLPILAATSAVVRAKGWVSAGRARAYNEAAGVAGGLGGLTPTSAYVGTYLFGALNKETAKLRAEIGPVTDEDEAAAEAAVAFWTAESGTSDYVQNAKLLCEVGRLIPRAFGLAVSLVPVAQGNIAKRAVEAQAAETSEHVGVVGERSQFEVENLGERHIESDFGTKTLVTLRTREGALVKWWATGDYSFLPEVGSGEFITIAGTVKSHGEFRGRKETTLSRVGLPPARKPKKGAK
jgi:hypothetical protein